MGRYYYGTISGKFLFAIQSSFDASLFKDPSEKPPEPYDEYYDCCCIVENKEELYCKKCFSSYQEHYDKLDECNQEDIEPNGPITYTSVFVKYHFDKDELDYIGEMLDMIEKDITKNSKKISSLLDINVIEKLNFQFVDSEEFDYTIDDDFVSEIYKDKNKNQVCQLVVTLIASWCFGKQIQEAVKQKGTCDIYCET